MKRWRKLHRVIRSVGFIVGVLFFLVGSSVQAPLEASPWKDASSKPLTGQAQPKPVFDPWKLGPFIEGDEVPPKDMVVSFKSATIAPADSGWYNYVHDKMVPEIERVTNGLVSFKLYSGGMLGDEANTIKKMRMKQIHVVGVTNIGTTMLIPEMCVLGLPFLFDWEPDLYYGGKYCEIDYILEKLENSWAKLAAEKGIQYLGCSETALDFITSQVPIKRVEDFRRLKFWVWQGDRIRPYINKAFGFGKVTSAEIYDVAAMLSTGMVDSCFMGWYVHVTLQWWPYVKYATDYPLYGYESAGIFLDRRVLDRAAAFMDKWGKLYGFKDGQDVIRRLLEATDRLLTEMRFTVRRDEAKAKREFIMRGALKEIHFPAEELEKLRQKVLPLYDKLADKLYPRWLLDEILKYRQEYRKLKAEGKLTADWYERGILPEGDQHDQWRTEWEYEPR